MRILFSAPPLIVCKILDKSFCAFVSLPTFFSYLPCLGCTPFGTGIVCLETAWHNRAWIAVGIRAGSNIVIKIVALIESWIHNKLRICLKSYFFLWKISSSLKNPKCSKTRVGNLWPMAGPVPQCLYIQPTELQGICSIFLVFLRSGGGGGRDGTASFHCDSSGA